jgi:hypothetical protein
MVLGNLDERLGHANDERIGLAISLLMGTYFS